MGEVTHEQVDLMLRLYEMRREPRLRQAREWFVANFSPSTPEEFLNICPPGSDANTSYRMVTSYWEMVANIVNRGLIDEEFFFENSGEQWLVWDRLRPIVSTMRTVLKNPHVWANMEKHCTRFEAWREKRAPGTTEAMRELMKRMAPKPAGASPAAKTAGND